MSKKTSARRDHLDENIDRFLDNLFGFIGCNAIRLVIVAIVLGAFTIFMLPVWQSWIQYAVLVLSLLFQLMFAILFMIIQFVALFWFLGKPKLYWVMPGETGVGFKDYKGNPEVLESASRIVLLLKGVKEFKEMGGENVRGLLLSGPPGTGKSYLAQCISTEAGVPFGYLSAPTILGMFMGMDMLRVWNLYRKARGLARKYGACILFIDEIDAIGRSRQGQMPGMGMGGMMMGGGSQALNQLLNEMDPIPRDDSWKAKLKRKFGLKTGRAEIPYVLTMGATNIPEALDAALLRPGRFDRKITVDFPSADGRREILEYYLSKLKHEEMNMDDLVGDTIGYTPVAIKYVLNEAVVQAHFSGRTIVTYEDFSRAREVHELGLRQPIRNMSVEEKRRLAYHEAGHAVAFLKLMPHHRVVKVTIIRHGRALGLVAPKPIQERYTETKDELLAELQVNLASRAAEELFLGIQMNGVTSDLSTATQVAAAMIGVWGMNNSYFSSLAFGGISPDGDMKRQIDKLLREQYAKAKRLLWENRDLTIAIAEEVLEKEELSYRELMALVQRVDDERNRVAVTGESPVPTLPSPNGQPSVGLEDGRIAAYERADRPIPPAKETSN